MDSLDIVLFCLECIVGGWGQCLICKEMKEEASEREGKRRGKRDGERERE